jgi:hypothetical protein
MSSLALTKGPSIRSWPKFPPSAAPAGAGRNPKPEPEDSEIHESIQAATVGSLGAYRQQMTCRSSSPWEQ